MLTLGKGTARASGIQLAAYSGTIGVDCDLTRRGLKLAERGGRNGRAAMLLVRFDFVVDTGSNPLAPAFSLPPFAENAKERGTHCVGNARKIKSLGHPPDCEDCC